MDRERGPRETGYGVRVDQPSCVSEWTSKSSECDGERSQVKGAFAPGFARNPLLKHLLKFLERTMKPRNNRRLIVIPALIRISSHDPTPHARSNLNGLIISRCAAWTSLG